MSFSTKTIIETFSHTPVRKLASGRVERGAEFYRATADGSINAVRTSSYKKLPNGNEKIQDIIYSHGDHVTLHTRVQNPKGEVQYVSYGTRMADGTTQCFYEVDKKGVHLHERNLEKTDEGMKFVHKFFNTSPKDNANMFINMIKDNIHGLNNLEWFSRVLK